MIAAVLIALALLAAPAHADHSDSNLPWPGLLPPQNADPQGLVQPHGVKNCRRASIKCIDKLIVRLRRQWKTLDAECDHRALASRAYLLITRGLREDLARKEPRWFQDRRYMTYVIATFSNRYFKYYNAYSRGLPVPQSWRITYDMAMKGDTNGGQDTLLFSNAHTQHDLPYVYAEQGVRTPDGKTRKPDHDGVNEVNTRVFDQLEDEYAERYDPFFTMVDMKPLPFDEIGTQEMVKGWREGAWRNAERLLMAKTPEERADVERDIDTTADVWAHALSDMRQPGYREQRDRHCRAAHGEPMMG